MNKGLKHTVFVIFLLLISVFNLLCQEIPPAPIKYIPVHDFAGILQKEEFKALTEKLILYEDSTSTQIVIVIMDTLVHPDIEIYANNMFQAWGIGQKNANNGLLILAALKNHKIRFEVGYGLEARLPDAFYNNLYETQMKTRFRGKQYYEALD